jgi:aldose 1-epimerase
MRYSVAESSQDTYRVIHLRDEKAGVVASIAPQLGNNAFSLCAHDSEFVWKPNEPLRSLHERKALFGIPFLAPWANRIDQHAFWVNDTLYQLRAGIGNIREDSHHQPIHGLLLFEPWTVERVFADDRGATMIARFPFASHPKLMAQFPFAHQIEMRHTVCDGRLTIRTTILSECAEPLPVAVGFHPYFRLPDGRRDNWTLRLAAREHNELNELNIPTGKVSPLPSDLSFGLADRFLDDVYTGLTREAAGSARFEIRSEHGSIGVDFGPSYPVAVVYAPPGHDFVCIEPMAAITNAFNAAHAGAYRGLQHVDPFGSWEEEFSVEPREA